MYIIFFILFFTNNFIETLLRTLVCVCVCACVCVRERERAEARRAFYAIKNLSKFIPILIWLKIFQSVIDRIIWQWNVGSSPKSRMWKMGQKHDWSPACWQRNTPNKACRAELGQYPLLMHIEEQAIKFWKHLKMSDPSSSHFKTLKNHEVNPEQSSLIQMVLKLQKQTNTANNIQHQDTETSIHQIIKAQKENDLTYWNGTTEKPSKLQCYLALNRLHNCRISEYSERL